ECAPGHDTSGDRWIRATYTAGGVVLSRGRLRLLLLRHRHGQDVRLLAPRALHRRVHRRQAEPLAEAAVHLGADVRGVLQELPRGLAALADALAVHGVPRARLLDHLVVHAEVEQVAFLADPLAVEDVELRLAEGRRDLVLHHLDLGPGPDHHVAFLERRDAPDVEAHGSVELQRAAAGSGLRVAEHDPDLLAELVDEDQARLALG